MTAETLDRFAGSARRYCAWVEGQPSEPRTDLTAALTLLADMYACSLGLHVLSGPPPDAYDRVVLEDHAREHAAHRFAALPVQRYSYAMIPFLPAGPPTIGALAEDLFDTYMALKHGLLHYDLDQREAAAWDWSFSRSDWGQAATRAMYVMECWLFGDEGVAGR